MAKEPENLKQLLDRIDEAANGREVVLLESILNAVGRRSFGPLLLLAGVILVSPLSGIPALPTTMSLLVLLTAVQLLAGRERFWLPRWILKRSITRNNLDKALRCLRPVAGFVDRFLRTRLTGLIHGGGIYVIAVICAVIAAGIPVMELVPFSATSAGAALTAFGLSLIARDGFLALTAFLFTVATLGAVAHALL